MQFSIRVVSDRIEFVFILIGLEPINPTVMPFGSRLIIIHISKWGMWKPSLNKKKFLKMGQGKAPVMVQKKI
jgi:hypothetical protein